MSSGPSEQEVYIYKRRRAFKPKARSGCKTCRVRHVKCDETKPACLKCSKTGRKCDGYQSQTQQQPLVPRPQPTSSFTPSGKVALPVVVPLMPLITSETFNDPLERRSFAYFMQHTIPQLSGILTSDFWSRLVMQTAHYEPAIKHAVVALGSLHESFRRGESHTQELSLSKTERTFATSQYVRAIGLLVGPEQKEKQKMDVALIACVLFVCFEVLRCNNGSAISHIDGGAKILKEYEETLGNNDIGSALTTTSNPYVSLSTLRLIFTRLDTQASQMIAGRSRQLYYADSGHFKESASSTRLPPGSIARTLTSIENARDALDDIWTSATSSLESLSSPAKMQMSMDLIRSETLLRLKVWIRDFKDLIGNLERTKAIMPDTQKEIHAANLQWNFVRIAFSVDHIRAATDETVWDAFLPEYESMLGHAEAIFELSRSNTSSQAGVGEDQPIFTLDTSILFPLYFIAVKCRQSTIRRRAIALLNSEMRREGLWSSKIMALVAERVVEIEEQGQTSMEDLIGREKRIRGLQVTFETGERRAELVFCGSSSTIPGMAVPPIREFVEW
ncbi:hypothetical protein B0J14DRAFT_573682 [Halenospora varia]|nr:hypothetical protein B0J14DRAFT_573682 [Halenospora varia]